MNKEVFPSLSNQVLSHSVTFNLCKPMDCSRQAPLSMGILQARILEWIAMPSLPGYLPNPGIKTRSPALQADSLPSEPPRKTPTSCIRLQHVKFIH